MTVVLVTGGTGALGRHLVPELISRNHTVRVLSRAQHPSIPSGASAVRADIRDSAAVRAAATGVDAVIHAATSPLGRMRSTEIEGTRNVLDAAQAHGACVIYVSIVGVERYRSFPYYRAKAVAERVVSSFAGCWTIQRVTQFHSLLDKALGRRLCPTTAHLKFQPIAEQEASVRLADLLDQGTVGRVPDIGGPEVLTMRALRDIRREITGRRTMLLRMPRVGPARDLDECHHLAPDEIYGQITWKQWLRAQHPST